MASEAPRAVPAASILRDPGYVVALVVAVVVALGFGLIIPVLPLFARQFGVGLFAVTLVTSVFAGVRLLSNLYTGGLADRIGTRSAIAWGAWIVAGSSLLIAVAPSYWWLLVVRGMGGFGSALFFNALLVHVVGMVDARQRGRAVGGLQAAFLFGIAAGPVPGGLLADPLGLRWPFVIYALACFAAGSVAWVFLPRATRGGSPGSGPTPTPQSLDTGLGAGGAPAPRRPAGVRPLLATARRLCRDDAFVAALVMMAASRWSVAGVRFSLVPVFADEVVGASATVLGVTLGLGALVHLLVAWPAGKAADTFGRKTVGAPAYFAFAAIAAGVAFGTTVPAFVTMMALYGLGTGLTAVTPPAVAGDVTPKHETGVAVGVLNSAGDLGSVVGPLLSGALADAAGYGWGFGSAAAMLVLGGVAAVRMRETLPAAR